MTKSANLVKKIEEKLGAQISNIRTEYDEVTLECEVGQIKALLTQLKTAEGLAFEQLIDLCAVDYLLFGVYDWETDAATENGFSRGVERQETKAYIWKKPRFGVVYHLLSTSLNHRVRVKVYVGEEHLVVPSVHDLWKGAEWFEREAYDLYGILFENNPDLRRILTDYGFIGHPFRKDFPVSGYVEMRYDAQLQKVIYDPVDIEPRTLVPKVIRKDTPMLDKPVNQS